MMTLQQEWENYAKKVYPGGMTESQTVQVYQAFIAGAGVMFGSMTSVVDLPDEEAFRAITRIGKEVVGMLHGHANVGRARN